MHDQAKEETEAVSVQATDLSPHDLERRRSRHRRLDVQGPSAGPGSLDPGDGNPAADGDTPKLDGSLVNTVIDTLKPRDEFSKPGIYQVTIPKIQLDPTLFKAGHTVDIQAKVTKLDPQGRDSTLWESKPYGERLAVAGKDDLTAGWPHRPFQVEWNTGEQIVVEVFDRKTGLFMEPKKFILAPPDVRASRVSFEDRHISPRAGPKTESARRSAEHHDRLSEPACRRSPTRPRVPPNPGTSQRIGNSDSQSRGDAADSPIIIK